MIDFVRTVDSLLLAIVINSTDRNDGIEFYTEPDMSLQLGLMCRPAGYSIPRHIHIHSNKESSFTNEVLFIRSGRVEIDFYDDLEKLVARRIVSSGDVVMLVSGGHGFKFLEDSDVVEVKQGPYFGVENDKVRF